MTTITGANTPTIASDAAVQRVRSARRRLAEALTALRARGRRISLESLFLTVGTLCLPIGAITILLGWYGAAHTGHVYEQNDYLISGGLFGLGLVVIGGVLSLGAWFARQVRATEAGSQQTLRALARLYDLLASQGTAGTPEAERPAGVVVVTERGSMMHRPGCPAVADRTVRVLSPSDAAGYRSCGICMPAD